MKPNLTAKPRNKVLHKSPVSTHGLDKNQGRAIISPNGFLRIFEKGEKMIDVISVKKIKELTEKGQIFWGQDTEDHTIGKQRGRLIGPDENKNYYWFPRDGGCGHMVFYFGYSLDGKKKFCITYSMIDPFYFLLQTSFSESPLTFNPRFLKMLYIWDALDVIDCRRDEKLVFKGLETFVKKYLNQPEYERFRDKVEKNRNEKISEKVNCIIERHSIACRQLAGQ